MKKSDCFLFREAIRLIIKIEHLIIKSSKKRLISEIESYFASTEKGINYQHKKLKNNGFLKLQFFYRTGFGISSSTPHFNSFISFPFSPKKAKLNIHFTKRSSWV